MDGLYRTRDSILFSPVSTGNTRANEFGILIRDELRGYPASLRANHFYRDRIFINFLALRSSLCLRGDRNRYRVVRFFIFFFLFSSILGSRNASRMLELRISFIEIDQRPWKNKYPSFEGQRRVRSLGCVARSPKRALSILDVRR